MTKDESRIEDVKIKVKDFKIEFLYYNTDIDSSNGMGIENNFPIPYVTHGRA